jgi:hypothetical protein
MLVELSFIPKRQRCLLNCVPLANNLKQAHAFGLIFQKPMHKLLNEKLKVKASYEFFHPIY